MIEDKSGRLSAKARLLIERAVTAVFQDAGKRFVVTVIALDEIDMREMNLLYRHVDSVTDVLSFPACADGGTPEDGYYGDILLCPARASVQAELYGHSVERELAFLAVHGALHLLGYDHEKPGDETLMREKQSTILERMGQAI